MEKKEEEMKNFEGKNLPSSWDIKVDSKIILKEFLSNKLAIGFNWIFLKFIYCSLNVFNGKIIP